MTAEELEQEVKEIISQVIEIPSDEIDSDADFVNDLGTDSLSAIEITGAIEKRYKIIIPEERIRTIRTVNQALALTKQMLNLD
jgi:acyl carrier protein